MKLIYFIVLSPLIGCFFNTFFKTTFSSFFLKLSGVLGVLISLVASLFMYRKCFAIHTKTYDYFLWDWINIQDMHIDFSFHIDELSIVMLLVISSVGVLVNIYSCWYIDNTK